MNELQVDKIYTNKDMADWFGLTYNGFRNQKVKKLEEFKQYAEFEIITGGKIKVNRVIKPIYTKHYKKEGKWFKKKICQAIKENPYQTYAHLGLRLKEQESENEYIKDKSLQYVINEVQFYMEEMFKDDGEYGTKGEIIWCQYTEDKGLDPISREQLKFFRNTAIDEFSKSSLDLTICENQKNFKETGDRDYADTIQDISAKRYKKIMDRFKKQFGFTPVAATKYNLRMIILDNGRKKVLKKEKKRRASIN